MPACAYLNQRTQRRTFSISSEFCQGFSGRVPSTGAVINAPRWRHPYCWTLCVRVAGFRRVLQPIKDTPMWRASCRVSFLPSLTSFAFRTLQYLSTSSTASTMLFIKTVFALSFAAIALAAPTAQLEMVTGLLGDAVGCTSYLNSCPLSTSLIRPT